jgi:hypothetical protein
MDYMVSLHFIDFISWVFWKMHHYTILYNVLHVAMARHFKTEAILTQKRSVLGYRKHSVCQLAR